MKHLILFLFLFSAAQAQTYISPFTMGTQGGELLRVNTQGDTLSIESVSAMRAQGYRIQGAFETWMTVGPNVYHWRDMLTGKHDSLENPYGDMHGFVKHDLGFIFIINEPDWVDSVRHFRIEWQDLTGNVTGTWHSSNHLIPAETDSAIVFDEGNGIWNAWHPNWITEAGLLSCRHTNTIYMISPGKTHRRIKGAFRAQHAAHFMGPNRILLFDNLGDSTSRALVVDTFGLTVEAISPENRKGEFMGSAQRLANGNTLICWGGALGGLGHPEVEEYGPFGNVVWALDLPAVQWTYQAWRGNTSPLMSVQQPIVRKPVNQAVDLLGRVLR